MENAIGEKIYQFAEKIFPYYRCLTGEGVRQTLDAIQKYISPNGEIDFRICAIPSGTKVFDWEIPKEWKIIEGYIEDETGVRIIDMHDHNLHIVGYSTKVDKWVELDELKQYIYTQPDQPDWIPYVTSYYKERFGFCMSENMKNSLKPGRYHMFIDSELFDGYMNYGEVIFPGELEQEIFFSTYICHPSMANNECSGPALSATLIKYVNAMPKRKYTYRFIFIPETIGALAYMSHDNNLAIMKKNMIAGFNLTCVGDERDYSIVESKYADTLADKVLKNVLGFHTSNHYSTYSFLKRGSDERQYNAPGIELPVVGFSRSKFHEFPEYHSSADDMRLVTAKGFQGSYDVMIRVIEALEQNGYYKLNVLGEPQLGKRGLYPTISQKGEKAEVTKMMDLITYLDGKNDIIDISNRIGVAVEELIAILERLKQCDLVK